MAITKCINSESKQYKPVLTDKLVLDAVPTVNSLNSVTSDAVARAIAGASGEVPQVTENDNGKILTATYDALGPAVSWEEAPSGIPDMTGNDGKILGAVDNDGTMEAQWINKPESNVTTSTKQFVVGVNGTGMPITVDCANASETAAPGTVEVAGVAGRNNLMGMDGVFFAVNGIDPNSAVTVTFPEDLGNASATGGFIQYVAWYKGAPGALTNLQAGLSLSPTNIDGNVLMAGTYTVTGTAPSFTPDGIGLFYTGGGDAATQIVADVTAAASTLTVSATASVVTGYSIKPSVIATPGSDEVAKVLTVTDTQGNFGWQPVPQELPPISTHAGEVLKVNAGATGVEWATPSGGGGSGVVELITVTSTAASDAKSLYNQVNSAVTNGKIPVLFTSNSSNSRLMRYWYLHRTNSWTTSDKYYVFRSIDTPFDQSTSKYSYVANEMNVGTGGGSNYVIECYTIAVASGLTWATLDPFTA